MHVASVNISSQRNFSNESRVEDLLQIINKSSADFYVFPAGYFSAGKKEALAEYDISTIISPALQQQTVAVGFDGKERDPWPQDQTALAIDQAGIVGAARKFFPTYQEREYLASAESPYGVEQQLSRVIPVQGENVYMAVCYDSFGIRKQAVPNKGNTIITNHIHGFFPQGEGNSGDTYFIRHGLAGVAREWGCPVIGAAIFFRRDVPKNWQAGVVWNQGKKSTRFWKYENNPLQPSKDITLDTSEGYARILTYSI